MKYRSRHLWIPIVLFVIFAAVFATLQLSPSEKYASAPLPGFIKTTREHMDHSALIDGPFADARDVTRACAKCHPEAAGDMMRSSHFQWLGEKGKIPGRDGERRIGKRNLINNFCLSINGNWATCTSCHAGYGWTEKNYDFTDSANVDCLVCHDTSATYVKGDGGWPKKDVDLVAVAKSVGVPGRSNCGVCHDYGGGGLGVKHGDLDNTLDNPQAKDDVHMGRENMLCIDCHKTKNHNISGHSMSVSVTQVNGVFCTNCHTNVTHRDLRITAHLNSVACETCHIPTYARRVPTKMEWDWSKAGDTERNEDAHEYMENKGEFRFAANLRPEYFWWNGTSTRYLTGDVIDPQKSTRINFPLGGISDPSSRIYPFKVHRAKQPYDAGYNRLAQPVTAGERGYWRSHDWDDAMAAGAELLGMKYSGKYGFAETEMYWPLAHMVTPSSEALTCTDCHGESDRFDWIGLGYPGDPMRLGGRR